MKEEEFQKIWSLNKVGNVEHTRNILTYQIEQKEIYEDELVDYNYLYNKYKKYKRWWTTKYGNRDEKYIGKDNEFKTIYDFVKSNMFHNEFEIDKNSADYYLGIFFPKKSELDKELNEFNK